MKEVLIFLFVLPFTILETTERKCNPSATTVSGTFAPTGRICSEDLIFEDNFESFNLRKWQHENTLGGGGNSEFQWYNNNRTNSFTKDGLLTIRPSLLADHFGEHFLTSGTLNLNDLSTENRCTNPLYDGCERVGNPNIILNPIKSARIETSDSFRFKYGKVEFLAKMPTGNWLWPALWLLPVDSAYGTWPVSGEIDVTESRGNKHIFLDGLNIGREQVSSALHFAPKTELNAWEHCHFTQQSSVGYNTVFKKYQMEWTPDFIKFSIDDVEIGMVVPPNSGGFWKYGNFDKSAGNMENPWRHGTKMAPFDKEFYLIINLAIGGRNFFPEAATYPYPYPKPWTNNAPTAMKDFYEQRSNWLKTWHSNLRDEESASLQLKHVKVWAI